MPNYVLGSGKVYVDLFDSQGRRTGERYLGVTSELTVNIATTKVEHQNTDEGIAVKDDEAVLTLTRNGGFKGSDMIRENIALFILGTTATLVQTSGSLTAQPVNAGVVLLGDRWYQLGVVSGNPGGARRLSAVVLKTGGTTHVAGTDYVMDAESLELGRFYVPEGSPMIGVVVTADFTKAAVSRKQVLTSAQLAQTAGALRFISKNARGEQADYYFASVTFSADGDLALKSSSAYQEYGFAFGINQLDAVTPHIQIDGRPFVP